MAQKARASSLKLRRVQEQESRAPAQAQRKADATSHKSPRRTSKFAHSQATIPALRDAGQ